MATILNRQVTFATNGTVTAAGLHNLIDDTEIYAGLISTQTQIASVGSSDMLLIADADGTSTSAPNMVTVGSMFNDALNNGIYTTGSFTNKVTAGSFVGALTGNVTGSITATTGTIANLSTTLTGDFSISGGTATLGTSGATASTYGTTSDIPRITIDAKGRITSATTVTAPVGFRNRVINGDMRIDQRNAGSSQTFTAAAALAYSVDRFYGYCVGANVTGQRVAGTAPNEFVYRFTGAASVTAIGFGTRLEATNTTDLAGSTATLSVQLANSLLTSVTWTAYYANSTDAFGTLASPTRTQIATGTFTVTSTLTKYSTQISIPSAATTGIEIVFTVGSQTSGTWTIDNIQLESGATSTDFERRFIGTELALCQRYFYKTYDIDVAVASSTSLGGILCETIAAGVLTRLKAFNQRLPVSMRATPTITLYSQTGTADRINVYSNTASTLTVSSTSGGNTNSLFTYLTTTASATAAETYSFQAAASAEL
jgi:hypothetical protein